MQFRISDTFTASLTRLKADEQKAVKTTTFDLQVNPANPGIKLHRVERAKDKNFWSIRAGRDLRIIVHRTEDSLLLCYTAHHDQAYRWAEHRKLETHPRTGAAQLIELREQVREIPATQQVAEPPVEYAAAPATAEQAVLFHDIPDEQLLAYGVPENWLDDVHQLNEDTLLDLVENLPGEAAEALLELATGGIPQPATASEGNDNPFEHPDAQRRFHTIQNREQLEQALEYPWEKWIVFLHPEQRRLVESSFNGPVRISGSAGTGKSIVALHRAVYLTRAHQDARVLLATFSDPLASALAARVRRLIANEPVLAERLEVRSIEEAGLRLAAAKLGKLEVATDDDIRKLLAEYSVSLEGSRFTQHFLWDEWSTVVDAWQLTTWEQYRDVPRLGRKTRLAERQRATLWEIFEQVRQHLTETGKRTVATVLSACAERIEQDQSIPYDFIIVDEAQDMGVQELRLLAALSGDRRESLFFTGDLGQRIFQPPFSWKSLGVDIQGRSYTLRVNYRTSHQIRKRADRLLPALLTDVDGNEESRSATVSLFNGDPPVVQILKSQADESQTIAEWLKSLITDGYLPHEIGVFTRTTGELARAGRAIEQAGLKAIELTDSINQRTGHVAIGTMHLAKGLEFKAVAVMACDEDVLPLQERIETVGDLADLEDLYNTERNLLYVACTRARNRLLVTGVEPGSEFLDDLGVDRI